MTDRSALVGAGLGLALLAAGSSVSSCVTTPDPAACADACAIASRCGLLPSALGGTPGASRQSNREDCEHRCEASDANTRQVKALLALLGDATVAQDEPLCSLDGTDACHDLIEDLEADPDTSELEVTTRLTVRMTSAASHVTLRSLSSWCCFDYVYELTDAHEPSTDRDEVEAIHDMIEPTYRCLTALSQYATDALAELEQMTPDQDAADGHCECIRAVWTTPPDEVPKGAPPDPLSCTPELDVSTDVCELARRSSRLAALDPPMVSCDQASLRTLTMELGDTIRDWNLEPGGPLVEPLPESDTTGIGTVRPLDEVRTLLREQIRGELTRPRGFLDEACEDLEDELAAAGTDCEGLDRDAPPEASSCQGGPTCSAADCLEASPPCDVTLCDADGSPPGRECGALGITEIRLGYRTVQGLEILGEPITGCENLAEVSTTFEDVKIGPLVPIAIVSGVLPSSYYPDHATDVGDGAYSWIVEGDARWVAAGDALLEVPSPMLELLGNEIEDPLEALGWVTTRLPTGQACDTDPQQCEGYFNDNCDNGLDDDGDGLFDLASPWCDRLLEEAERRCVVVVPGRAPFADCDQGP